MRRGDVADVIALLQPIRETAFCEWEDAELLGSHLACSSALNFVAADVNRLVGAVIAGSLGVRGAISHIAVIESQRRRGIAHALVDEVLAGFRALGIRRVFLFADRRNEPAHELWSRCGFCETHDDATWERDL